MTARAPLRVLELGSFVSVAYAGRLLVEQGHHVTKWLGVRPDPIRDHVHGDQLWQWLTAGKAVEVLHASGVDDEQPGAWDVVLDNIRAATWAGWGISPAEQAARLGVVWVSLRDDLGDRSFDMIAQARAWGDLADPLPFWLGDTAAGLWMAFKALAAPAGHHVLGQATVLAKLVEGDTLRVDRSRPYPFDPPGTYRWDAQSRQTDIQLAGVSITEPARDQAWRDQHLWHNEDGGYRV